MPVNVTAGDNFFYLLFVFNDYCLHNYILLIELQRWKLSPAVTFAL